MIEQKLDSVLHYITESFELAGLSVGVVQENEIVYTKGFGLRNIKSKEPVTPTSLFHLASISKPFVATAIVQLVEKGQVDLNRPVVSYVPYFKLDDDRYRDITVQQMLSHISGMPDEEDYSWERPEEDDGALERYVRSLTGQKLLFAPGAKFAYSNIAFEVLGDLIAKISGQSFEDYVADNILKPLEMVNSTFLRKEVPPELATTPHLNVPRTIISEVYPYHRAHAPSSTLHSNALDMCNWAIANLNRGHFKRQQILDPTSYDSLWYPYFATGQEDKPDEFVGLSWFIDDYKGHQMISHAGGDIGFNAEFAMLPEQGAALVVMCNSVVAPAWAAKDLILDLLLGLEPELPKPLANVPLGETLAKDGLEAALEHYHRLKENQPDVYDFSPEQFYDLAYILVEMKQINQAVEVFKLNTLVHPDSDDAYTKLAWACRKNEDKQSALENVQQALHLNPDNSDAQEMLAELSET